MEALTDRYIYSVYTHILPCPVSRKGLKQGYPRSTEHTPFSNERNGVGGVLW